MADQFTKEQLEIFKDTFLQFDKDGDQSISTKELRTVMRALGMNVNQSELKAMIREVDSDNSGSIEFDEFLTMVANKCKDTDVEEETRLAFKLFDESGTGYVSTLEMKNLLTSLGEKLTEKEISEMLSRADFNQVGKINYEAFIKKMMDIDTGKKKVQFKPDETVLDHPGGSEETVLDHPGPSNYVSRNGHPVRTQANLFVNTTKAQEKTRL